MKCLFVGGHADGEWREVDERQPEILVIVPHDDYPHPKMTGTSKASFSQQSYRREEFMEDNKRYFVYVHGIQPGRMFEALCSGYLRKAT